MFPDFAIAQNFSMSETKWMYVISHGIEPYVQSLLVKQIKDVNEYVLLFDETLSLSSKYFKSVFFGHGTAVDLNNIIENHVQNTFGYNDLIQLAMDGPNVNWALYDKLETTLIN